MKLIGKYSVASALRWLLGFVNVFVMIGAIATIRVNIRLFTPPTVKGNGRGGLRRPPRFTLSVTRAGARRAHHEYRWGHG